MWQQQFTRSKDKIIKNLQVLLGTRQGMAVACAVLSVRSVREVKMCV